MSDSFREKITGLAEIYKTHGNAVFAKIDKKDFLKTMEKTAELTERISSISGHDNGKTIELVYTFTSEKLVLNIKVEIDRKKPKIESVTKLFPGAGVFERENFEMLGVVFSGNKNLKKILLGKKSPKTPLRKSIKEGE